MSIYTKQTAGNNAFLANVRTVANDAIYRHAAELYNLVSEEEAVKYLATQFKTLDFAKPLPASYRHSKASKRATFEK